MNDEEHTMSERTPSAFSDVTETDVRRSFESEDYVAGDDIVTTVALALRLGKPLLVEGEPGAGKTELAKVLAGEFDAEFIRLQCYEGLTAESALYEWNYTKQLLSMQSDAADTNESMFSEESLFERPLLRSLRGDSPRVLLIDEVDRADEEFEALLLEIFSDFQVSVPELGTVSATTPPVVVITSNRTRGLSDALKRRCLFLHVAVRRFPSTQCTSVRASQHPRRPRFRSCKRRISVDHQRDLGEFFSEVGNRLVWVDIRQPWTNSSSCVFAA